MTKDEYYVMKIRQKSILMHHLKRIQGEIKEIDEELEKIPDREFIHLKRIADGIEHYHTL